MTAGVFLAGAERPGRGSERDLLEPFSGRAFATVAQASHQDLEDAVEAAGDAFEAGPWRQQAPLRRADVLWRCAERMRAEAEELGALEARNVGRPLRECVANVGIAADAFGYFAGLASQTGGRTVPLGQGLLDYTVREPIGVCGLITPWNNPLVLASWKLAAALAAGNAVVLKPASQTPLSILRVAALLTECGLPPGQLAVLPGDGADLGGSLVGHAAVGKISFTGSTEVGKQILAACSTRLARVTLELGGKSPAIVFSDANLDEALAGSIPAMFGNAGQMCTARSRVLVQRPVIAEFTERLAERVGALRLGSPFDERTQLGPVISAAQRDAVCAFIRRAADNGAKTLLGGPEPPSGAELDGGFFVSPTILTDVEDGMEVAREEVFGPVLVVDAFEEEAEAVARANRGRYGLAATVWTRDIGRGHRVAGALEAGTVTINTTKVSHVYAPFGGWKESGLGSELGEEGLDEFLRTKNVVVGIS